MLWIRHRTRAGHRTARLFLMKSTLKNRLLLWFHGNWHTHVITYDYTKENLEIYCNSCWYGKPNWGTSLWRTTMRLKILALLFIALTCFLFWFSTGRYPPPIFLEHKNGMIIHPTYGSYPENVHERRGLMVLPGQRVIGE